MTARLRAPHRRDGGVVELLELVLADLPNRPHAACRGQHELYDAAAGGDPDAMRAASWICRRCPHAADCPDSTTEQEPADALAH